MKNKTLEQEVIRLADEALDFRAERGATYEHLDEMDIDWISNETGLEQAEVYQILGVG